ncbi:hypothetical protein RvY_06069 [Ramazzottius varieornatus]|uniref:Major facilitator superfamily associated domain-containing protein n=1 Tax=Ramazzottius varieornatus TaxID=947166 RepID=A0A1D1V082_RAMVA|nr:hypothetical protein RvY_06069 [Ramazzottius varieornatus]
MANENRGFVAGNPKIAPPVPPRPDRPPVQVVTQVRTVETLPPASPGSPVSHGARRPKSSPARMQPEPVDENQPQKQVKKKRKFCPYLVPLKFIIFLLYGAMSALYPFFSLHMRSIGISITETAIISFLLPIISCLVVPLVGSCADRGARYKWCIAGLTIFHVTCHLLLLLIPPIKHIEVRSPVNIPTIDISFPCHTRHNAIFAIPNHTSMACDGRNLTVTPEAMNEMQIEVCWTDCPVQHVAHEPSVCWFNASAHGHYCTKWTEMERQVFKDLVLAPVYATKNSNKTIGWETAEFKNDEGSLLRSAHCFQDYDRRIRPDHVQRDDTGSGRLRCSVFCRAQTSFAMMCRQTYREGNRWMTLLLYFLLRLSGLVGLLSVLVMMDNVTLQMVQERPGESFAAHRVFTSMAFVIFPMMSALLMSGVVRLNWMMEFHAAFFLFAALSLLAMFLVLCMKLPTCGSRQQIWKNAGRVFRQPQVIVVLITMLTIGMGSGYVGSFLFWFLEAELSATKVLMSFGLALADFLAIPLFLLAHKIIPATGYALLLVVALLMDTGRFTAYSYLTEAVYFIPIEVMTAVVIAVMFTIPAYFSHTVAPMYASTLQALFTGTTFGLGAGLGPLIGGQTISWYGHRTSFLIFAAIFAVVALLYAVIHVCCLRKKPFPPAPLDGTVLAVAQEKNKPLVYTGADRASDFYPDDTEVMLYREERPPKAELDTFESLSVRWSRPMSGISTHV